MSSLLEIKALAELIKNETGISKNTAVRIGNSLLEIITYFSSQAGGGGSNFVQGTVETTAELDANTVHGSWAVFLPENYADFGTAYFGLLVLPYANTENSFVQIAVVFEDSEANTFSIRARWGSEILGNKVWSQWKALSGGVAGAMLETDYTGEGTKPVNRATGDSLGREIHTTYALKQSGVTPPETARVILDDDTPTYSIEALTAENLIVENNATTGGEILAPALAADKTLKISIIGNDTLLNGTSYADGVTIFAIYEASTETWSFSSILDPTVPDYSDMTVDVMLDNPTVITSMGNGIIVAQFIHLNKLVFIKTHATPSVIGIYQCVGLYRYSGNVYLQLIAAGTALHTVRVKDGYVWYSQYDGKNAGTLFFERITVEKVAITKQGFNGELSPVVYPVDRQRTVIGYKLGSNATDFSVTINSVIYTKADVTNVVVPVNTEITINDVTIAVGKDTGNVVLILK